MARAQLEVNATTDAGKLVLKDSSGTSTITLDGDTGDISKTGSNGFLVPHPKDPTKEIFYLSLEGAERGMYARGSAKLSKGRALIALPEHFAAVARAEGMTVQLTPHSSDTYGLAVIDKRPDRIEVRELRGGAGDFGFDYVVMAERGDVPPAEVVRARRDALHAPAPEKPDADGDVAENRDTGVRPGTQPRAPRVKQKGGLP